MRIVSFIALMVFAMSGFACDEKCKREKAELEAGIEFPNHVTWKLCEDTAYYFMTSTLKQLDRYKDTRLPTANQVSLRNIKRLVNEQRQWLTECDEYMQLTDNGRIFKEADTTDTIFAAMDNLTEQLDAGMRSAVNATDVVGDPNGLKQEQFNKLLQLVEDHIRILQLRGQFVKR